MRHSASPRSRRDGMTLVETTIALTILSVGILAMLAAHVSALQQNNQGRHSTEAAQLARDEMEYLQRLPWTSTALQPSAAWKGARTETLLVQRATGQAAVAEQNFSLDWRVQAGANADLRRVDVRVTWNEDPGGTAAGARSFVMSSLRAND